MPDVEHTRLWVRDVVRSGLLPPDEAYAEVAGVVAADHPGLPAAETARAWIEEAESAWRADAATWPPTTDHDRLQRAFARLEAAGLLVLQGCADHWAATAVLRESPVEGVVWFTPTDVWHAIDEPMLELNVWHDDGANVSPGDTLLDTVIGALADAGLDASFDEGRVEVAARWQRRPPPESQRAK